MTKTGIITVLYYYATTYVPTNFLEEICVVRIEEKSECDSHMREDCMYTSAHYCINIL